MMTDDTPYWLALTLVKGVGAKTILRLVSAFGSARHAWEATRNSLLDADVPETLVTNLLKARSSFDFDKELEKVRKTGATLITLDDGNYPALLRKIDSPPPLLYVLGDLEPTDANGIAIVGTRSASRYGREATYKIAQELARHGITIISGLAQGIDTAAHRGALAVEGRTIGVLGCGIDRIYPEQSKALVNDILQKKRGAIISEFSIGTPPTGTNFPRRNRILSGLGRGVLVAEAPEGSGSLITADFALEQGRDVFALPANINTNGAAGTNRLIQEGATLITEAADILKELTVVVLPPTNQVMPKAKTVQRPTRSAPKKLEPSPVSVPTDLSEHEQALYTLLDHTSQHIDDLIRKSGLRTDIVISTITILELKGLAQMVAPMQYCRSH